MIKRILEMSAFAMLVMAMVSKHIGGDIQEGIWYLVFWVGLNVLAADNGD